VCFLLHFFLLVAVCCRDTLSILGEGSASLPRQLDKYWEKAEKIAGLTLGENLAAENTLRQAAATYLRAGGIQAGYGFFAPNIPNSHKLVFELHYGNGRVEYELPRVENEATGLRLTSLLDEIGRTESDALRELVLKMLAYSIWQEHADVTTIRAVFGYIDLPSLEQLVRGEKESYHFLYAYDFSFPSQPPQ